MKSIFLILFLTGCAYGTQVPNSPEHYKTQGQILQELGKPQSVYVTSNGEEIYTYAHSVGLGHSRAVSFTIKDGVVISHSWMEL